MFVSCSHFLSSFMFYFNWHTKVGSNENWWNIKHNKALIRQDFIFLLQIIFVYCKYEVNVRIECVSVLCNLLCSFRMKWTKTIKLNEEINAMKSDRVLSFYLKMSNIVQLNQMKSILICLIYRKYVNENVSGEFPRCIPKKN